MRRSVAALHDHVHHTVQNSPFLQQHVNDENDDTIAVFHRREIVTGPLIGNGGFSDVYEIAGFDLDPFVSEGCTPAQQQLREEYAASPVDSSGKGLYALKHLKRRLVSAAHSKEFLRAACDLAMEATYMSALNHPNILAVRGLPVDGVAAFESGDHDGYFLITDRLTGTLGDRIRDWKTTENAEAVPALKEKAGYALEIASALRYLHSTCRIVYRDLKPHNMGFAAGTGALQLFDFGLCRELPPAAAADGIDDVYEMSGVGTRRYMAPEIINDGYYNTKVDVYSWAMVVSELLTGTKPYASYSMDDHRVAVCQGGERPRLRLDWPAWLRSMLQRTWCESVPDRWSMDHVVAHLTRALRGVSRRRVRGSSNNDNNNILDSPVGVCEFDRSQEFTPDQLCALSIPDFAPRRVSLNPRLLSIDDDVNNNDDSSGLFSSVVDSSLLGLTLCLEDGIEVCANGNTLTLSPSSSRKGFGRHLPRRRMVPSCTV